MHLATLSGSDYRAAGDLPQSQSPQEKNLPMIAPEMPAAVVVALLELFEKAGIEVGLEGGWGVDALLGTQTRVHKDVDVIIGTVHVARIVELLSTRGYLVQHGGSDSNFVLAHP